MANKVAKKSAKEPIRLRQKALADGSQSLYLDYYIDGKRSYEFLKLYLLPGNSTNIKNRNEATLNAANTIKLKRILEYTNNKAGLKNTSTAAKQSLAEWMETFRQHQERKGVRDAKNIHGTIRMLSLYNIKIALKDIDRDYCLGLLDFMRNKYKTAKGTRLSANSIIGYFSCLRNALNLAVREEILSVNPIDKISVQDRVKAPESKREYLTIEEIHRLEETPCKYDIVKRAFLFACYCGLRLSDIVKLTWNDLERDGDKYRIGIVMQKTQAPIYMPLSIKAVQWIPERKDMSRDAKLFPKLSKDIKSGQAIKPWMEAAGITKPITFHSSRHSFATMMLTLGVDIYTVSKLLGHKSVQTTQIYAKIVNKKKESAVSLIDELYQSKDNKLS
jgi:integrase